MNVINTALAGAVPVTHRLALAVQPIDAVTNEVASVGLRAGRETPRPMVEFRRAGLRRTNPTIPIPAHGATGFVLSHRGDVRKTEIIRVTDAAQRFVPRRFAVPVWPAVRLAESDRDGTAVAYITTNHRLLRPWLLPGPAYRPPSGATGAMLRVVRPDSSPVRWARALAFNEQGERLGWAHGDGTGQVLLMIPRAAWPPPEPAVLTLAVRLFAPAAAGQPPSGSADVVRLEPLSDLPVEAIPQPPDPPGPPVLASDLLRGITPPPTHVVAAQDEIVTLEYGRVVTPPTVTFNPAP
jgi:hypothetical protein